MSQTERSTPRGGGVMAGRLTGIDLMTAVDNLALDARGVAATLEWIENVEDIGPSRDTLERLTLALRHVRGSIERLATGIEDLYYDRAAARAAGERLRLELATRDGAEA